MSSKGDSVDVDEKQVARSSRLTLRKNNEEVLRKELKAEARAKCAHTFKAFAECAKASSIFVVFQCRQENQASKC